jgi:phage-related protein
METERKITSYKHYFLDFIKTLDKGTYGKLFYLLDMLKTQDKLPTKYVKFIREGIYELRVEYESNAYRVFFCFDEGNIVILFNGFRKKTQKIPNSEIKQAIKLKNEYYANK